MGGTSWGGVSWVGALCAVMVGGCAPSFHAVYVELSALELPRESHDVEVELSPDRPVDPLARYVGGRELEATDAPVHALRIAELPRVPSGLGRLTLRVRDGAGAEIASTSMRVEVREASSFVFRLEPECAHVSCGEVAMCQLGECVPLDEDPPPAREAPDAGMEEDAGAWGDAGETGDDAGATEAGPIVEVDAGSMPSDAGASPVAHAYQSGPVLIVTGNDAGGMDAGAPDAGSSPRRDAGTRR
ncbi:MAG: hypothetical protein AB7S26_07295 [Sandaracinaceae bacterium]